MGSKISEEFTVKWDVSSAIRIGGRKEQQDSLGAFSSEDGHCCLLVVADGMGGHRGGALASGMLVDIAACLWGDCRGQVEAPRQFLEDLCQQANRDIHAAGLEQGLDPRTTVIAVLLTTAQAFWVYVGDSRLYRFHSDNRMERTSDHSLLQLLVDAGEVDESEMATHPDQNKLLRSIGEESPAKTTHGSVELQGGERFLLCSDGFWERIGPDEMLQLLAAENLDSAVNAAADTAAERGGPRGDNIAVVAVRAAGVAAVPKRRWRVVLKRTFAALIIAGTLAAAGWAAWSWYERHDADDPAAASPPPPAELQETDVDDADTLTDSAPDSATSQLAPEDNLPTEISGEVNEAGEAGEADDPGAAVDPGETGQTVAPDA